MKLTGYLPDVDETTNNAILSASNIIPTSKGIKGSRTLESMNWDTIAGSHSAMSVQLLGEVKRTFVANSSDIYEVVAGTKESVFTTTETILHSNVVSFGNMVVASTYGATKLLSALEGVGFTEITEAPKAKIIDVVSGFIMALNYDEIPNGWYSSGIQNPLEWTTGLATQSANGILYQTGGAIVAGKAINDRMLAFKEGSTYAADYVGGDTIWQWGVVSESVGCVGINAVAKTPQGLVFVSKDNIHLFNGNAITDIGRGVNNWFSSDRDETKLSSIQVNYSYTDKLLYIHYQSNEGVYKSLVLNMETDQWGIIDDFGSNTLPIGMLQYVKGGLSCDELEGIGDDIVGSIDNPAWSDNMLVTAYLGSNGNMYSLTGASKASSMLFNVQGNTSSMITIKKILPTWKYKPTDASAQHWFSNDNSYSLTKGKSANLFMNNFNIHKCAYLHQVELQTKGNFELVNIEYQFDDNGVIR